MRNPIHALLKREREKKINNKLQIAAGIDQDLSFVRKDPIICNVFNFQFPFSPIVIPESLRDSMRKLQAFKYTICLGATFIEIEDLLGANIRP